MRKAQRSDVSRFSWRLSLTARRSSCFGDADVAIGGLPKNIGPLSSWEEPFARYTS